ncbi:MAG: type II toxin-antitoxin system RelE/ParE family toxin [Actinobacteria bacterium]|nr:type II toxin-antitoxin system RelE/ParE family toxin [Actinomycetota bacterium]
MWNTRSFLTRVVHHDFKGLYSLRVGNFRVIYHIKDDLVIVLKIGHRQEVYENIFPLDTD